MEGNDQRGQRDRQRRRRRGNKPRSEGGVQQPSGGREKQQAPAQQQYRPPPQREPISYAVTFYETHADAKRDGEALTEKSKAVGQLNIVIRAEGDMDDPELTKFGKVYAGAAWALIHDRRVEEGWYEKPH